MRAHERVLVVAGGYYPDVGGGEALNARHARLMRDLGFTVDVVVPGAQSGVDPLGTAYHGTDRWNLANFRLIPPRSLEREIRERRPALIYFAGPHPHDLYGARIARRLRIPTAALYHADFRTDRALSRAATFVYGRTAARWFDAVGVTTHVYERRLRDRGVAQNRIEYLGMGVDAELFTPGAARPRSGGLLFVGRLDDNHTYKRLDLAIEALATLRERGVDAHLEVVGEGNRRAVFEEMAQRLGLASAVTFSGEVGGEELRDAYRRADALVLPSPSAAEGFGMVVLEAFACGCPVVTSVQAGAAEAVTASGEGGLWDGVSVDHLADTIAGVLQASASRDEVARTVRAYAETVHSWNAVGDRLGALLERALERARR